MKKNFKKFISTTLALGTLISTMPTLAMKPALTEPKTGATCTSKSSQDDVCLRLRKKDEQIKEFEAIAPGIFEVDEVCLKPDVTCILGTTLIFKALTTIFKKYPNITREFIAQVNRTTEKKFSVRLFKPTDLSLLRASPIIQNKPSSLPFAYFIMSKNKFELPILGQAIYAASRDLDGYLTEGYPADPGTNMATYYTFHELGHILSLTVLFSQHKDLLLPWQEQNSQIITWVNQSKEKQPSIEELKKFQAEHNQTQAQILEIFTEMKRQIIDIARAKYGYTGDGVVSTYGENNSSEWIADDFASSNCKKYLGPLEKATLEWFAEMDKKLAA